jgi:negative regulator of flagellin synthesis FlgM
MDIKGLGNSANPYEALRLKNEEAAEAGRSTRANAGAEAADLAGDAVSLSDEAKLRAAAYDAARKAPETREDKVARLKAQVDSGQYPVDSKALAGRLVQDDLDSPA